MFFKKALLVYFWGKIKRLFLSASFKMKEEEEGALKMSGMWSSPRVA